MAGDWIPMRTDLWECPQVVRILSASCPQSVRSDAQRCAIIGALYRTWSIIDRYCDDGILDGYSKEALDQAVGIDGWSELLESVGWLAIESQSLVIPGFEEWFSSSAKRRLQDAKRKRVSRKPCPQNVRNDADKKRTREQDRTEHINPPKSPKGDLSNLDAHQTAKRTRSPNRGKTDDEIIAGVLKRLEEDSGEV